MYSIRLMFRGFSLCCYSIIWGGGSGLVLVHFSKAKSSGRVCCPGERLGETVKRNHMLPQLINIIPPYFLPMSFTHSPYESFKTTVSPCLAHLFINHS